MKIAIIGSHSFSGNSYAAHVLRREEVLTISRSHELSKVFEARSGDEFKEQKLIWNLNKDSSHVIRAIQNNNIEIIVNFAAQSMVAESWVNPEDWYQTNVVSFSKFLNRLRNETEVKKFVHFSTPEVYGSTQGWVKESFNFAPTTPYAISRASSDWHLKALYENFDFPIIFSRAANVYGQYQKLYRIIPKVIISALTGKKVSLHGGGNSIRSFIHIHDINNALDKIISHGKFGESYHISTNELITIQALVERIAHKLNMKFSELVEETPDRPGKDFAYQLDSEKIRTQLSWKDSITLDEGLESTIFWIENNLSVLKKMPAEYVHRK
jgi:dTDP-glucose 4,6-dehydratase